MALSFPGSPTLNQTYTNGGKTWVWNGTNWYSANYIYDTATTSTGYFAISTGTTSQRPVSPTVGMLRYNTTVGTTEQYNSISSNWESIAVSLIAIAGVSTLYAGYATSLTISGNYFGLNAVTVRFSYGATIADVSVTPTATTSLIVAVPSTIYNLAVGTAGNISVIDSYGKQSNGFIINLAGVPGSTSTIPALSPYAIRQALNTTPTAGVYWFNNPGYNTGSAFQAYADWSIDATYGMMVLCGYNIADYSTVSFTNFGTAATASSGTPGFRTTHYLPSYNILGNWTGDTRGRSYLGMTSQTGGTATVGGASQKEWIAMGISLTVLRSLLDNAPGTGEFDIAGGIVNSSSGASGRLYFTSAVQPIYQLNTSGNTVNSGLWFEARDGGSDTNHALMVWGAGNGTYAIQNGPFATRWMFLAISPNNF